MKKILLLLLIVIVINVAFFHRNILKYIAYNFVYKYEVIDQEANTYRKEFNYTFVQATDDFYPDNSQDILNIMFTAINNGWQEFSFVCGYEYDTCEKDMSAIANDQEALTNINNYVHPYNSFDRLHIVINGLGKVSFVVTPLYSKSMIQEVDTWVDNVFDKKINDKMSLRTKILTIHNHIIDNTVYDKARADAIKDQLNILNNYSHIAYGIVRDKKAVCGGYADLMSIFLNRLGVENYKISTDTHVWNLVKYNDEWLHLDLTWDDPYTGTDKAYLLDDFFLIDTEELYKEDISQHSFDVKVFTEAVAK